MSESRNDKLGREINAGMRERNARGRPTCTYVAFVRETMFPGQKARAITGVAERGICKNRATRQTTACRRSPFHRGDRRPKTRAGQHRVHAYAAYGYFQ